MSIFFYARRRNAVRRNGVTFRSGIFLRFLEIRETFWRTESHLSVASEMVLGSCFFVFKIHHQTLHCHWVPANGCQTSFGIFRMKHIESQKMLATWPETLLAILGEALVTQRLGETVTVKMSKRAKSEMIFYDFRSNIRQVLLNHLIWWRVARSLGQAPAQWASKTFANVHSSARKSHKRRMFCKRAFDSHVTGVSLYVITGVFIVERVIVNHVRMFFQICSGGFSTTPVSQEHSNSDFQQDELEEFRLVPNSPCCFVSVPLQRALALCHGVLEMGWLAGHEEWQTDSWKLLQYSDLRCWDIFLEPEFFFTCFSLSASLLMSELSRL